MSKYKRELQSASAGRYGPPPRETYFRDSRGVLYERLENGQIKKVEEQSQMSGDNNGPASPFGAAQQKPQQVQLTVPMMLPVSDDLYITPTMLQLIVSMEVLPLIEGTDYFPDGPAATINPNGRKVAGSLKAGNIRLRLLLASGAKIEMDPKQADAFLTMIGVRQRLVEVPQIQM